jgi:hypothetical protein
MEISETFYFLIGLLIQNWGLFIKRPEKPIERLEVGAA